MLLEMVNEWKGIKFLSLYIVGNEAQLHLQPARLSFIFFINLFKVSVSETDYSSIFYLIFLL